MFTSLTKGFILSFKPNSENNVFFKVPILTILENAKVDYC